MEKLRRQSGDRRSRSSSSSNAEYRRTDKRAEIHRSSTRRLRSAVACVIPRGSQRPREARKRSGRRTTFSRLSRRRASQQPPPVRLKAKSRFYRSRVSGKAFSTTTGTRAIHTTRVFRGKISTRFQSKDS